MTPEQKNHDESILVLIFAEVKKITKHLKIDRRSKGNPADPDGAENANEEELLLRELSEKVSEIAGHKEFTSEQVSKMDELKTTSKDSIVHHRHAIDVVSSKIFFVLATMGFVIFLSLVLHIYQLDKFRAFRDNDLKYRYVKMHGEATPADRSSNTND